MKFQKQVVCIPLLLLLFLSLWISPACGGGNLSIFESTPKQQEQTVPTPKPDTSPALDQPEQGEKNSTPPAIEEDDDEDDDDWEEDSIYDNDKSC